MTNWLAKIAICFLVWGCGLASARGAADAALQAIQQAPDPSSAVAAYANGFAIDRNNPKLYEAYVARMVDLGLPEMAYHQAQTLTTLQANNGLAWGVVAYVDARRAQMPEAVSAINLAGQFAPDDKFVQYTAGELLAWYDLKADKAKIPDNARDGLTKVRSLLDKRPAFTEAYSTAQKAYQTQASGTSQPALAAPTQAVPAPAGPVQVAPDGVAPAPAVPDTPPMAPQAQPPPSAQADQVAPLGYAAPVAASAYYQDYSGLYYYPDCSSAYLDWGPDWVAPAPWCWWQPLGFWGGCDFYPSGLSLAFGDFDDFHHFHHDGLFDHEGRFGHNDPFGHNGVFGHGHDPALWYHDPQGRNSFFGTPARPSASVAQWSRAGSQVQATSAAAASSTGRPLWSSAGQHGSPAKGSASARSAQPSMFENRWGLPGYGSSTARVARLTATRGNLNLASSTAARPSITARNRATTVPTMRSWSVGSSAYRAAPTRPGAWTGQNHYAPSYAAPRAVAPGVSSLGSYRVIPLPSSSWAAPSHRAPGFTAPHYSMPGGGSFRGYGGWHHSAPMGPAPRSLGGSSFAGGFRGSSSFGGTFHGGNSFGGGFHSGGSFVGGFHGGGHR